MNYKEYTRRLYHQLAKEWNPESKRRIENKLSKRTKVFYGTCALCGNVDYLYPVTIEVCKDCANRIIETVGYKNVKINNIKPVAVGFCYFCLRPTRTKINMTVRICHNCTKKLGRRLKNKDD